MVERVIGSALGRTPAYEPRGFVTPMSVGGVVLAVLGIAGFFFKGLLPKGFWPGFMWMFGCSTLLSVGLSLLGTAVGRELVARGLSTRSGDLDRAETGFEEQLEELDPFARVQLIGRLALRPWQGCVKAGASSLPPMHRALDSTTAHLPTRARPGLDSATSRRAPWLRPRATWR
jgi:hypothetical protein